MLKIFCLPIAVIAALLAGCNTSEKAPGDYASWTSQNRADTSSARGAEYERSIVAPFEALKTPIAKRCEERMLALNKHAYVLSVDADGYITDVRSNVSSEIDSCLREMYEGARLPAPPSAPFHLWFEFE